MIISRDQQDTPEQMPKCILLEDMIRVEEHHEPGDGGSVFLFYFQTEANRIKDRH